MVKVIFVQGMHLLFLGLSHAPRRRHDIAGTFAL